MVELLAELGVAQEARTDASGRAAFGKASSTVARVTAVPSACRGTTLGAGSVCAGATAILSTVKRYAHSERDMPAGIIAPIRR